MKKLLIALLLLTGCATPSYLPALSNVTTFSKCSPVYTEHKPASVSMYETIYGSADKWLDIINANPTLADRFFPSASTVDALGKNAIPIGLAGSDIASAITGNLSLASIIASASYAGVKALTDSRSESKEQDRVGVCMPDDAVELEFSNGEVTLKIKKSVNL